MEITQKWLATLMAIVIVFVTAALRSLLEAKAFARCLTDTIGSFPNQQKEDRAKLCPLLQTFMNFH